MDQKTCSVSIAKTLHSFWKELASALSLSQWQMELCQSQQGSRDTSSPVAKMLPLLDVGESLPGKGIIFSDEICIRDFDSEMG